MVVIVPMCLVRAREDPGWTAWSGYRLVTAVAERARATGVRRLIARVLPENTGALRLVRAAFPVCLTRHDDDAVVLNTARGDLDTAWTPPGATPSCARPRASSPPTRRRSQN
ncbi:MAG: hypothetical protein L0H64_23365 [Pseudonocardia sp.]|nr:hypothetical protein [Pseudonocardia sp.]